MDNTKIVIRAFNKDGYHKDIMIACSKQIRMNDRRGKEPLDSMYSGLIGHGLSIDPKDFPEMTHFEVVISKYEV